MIRFFNDDEGEDGAFIGNVPDYTTNLKLWIDADIGVTQIGNFVSRILDQSGNGNDPAQGGADLLKPVLTPNIFAVGHSGLMFDGANKFLTTPTNLIGGNNNSTIPWTVFLTVQRIADTAGRMWDQIGIGGNYANSMATKDNFINNTYGADASQAGVNLVTAQDTVPVLNGVSCVIAGRWNGTNVNFWRNAVNKSTTAFNGFTTGATNNNNLFVIGKNVTGASSALFYNGYIGILRVYNEALSDANMGVVFNYINIASGVIY